MIRRRQDLAAPATRPAAHPAAHPGGHGAAAGRTDRPAGRTRSLSGASSAAVVAALAAVVLGTGGLAAPAAAHDEVTGTTPADGTSVEVAPAAVELTFSEPPLALGTQVQVTGPDGEVVNSGDVQITDTVVSQPLAADLPAGDYAVAWRVTSSDGHPISGELAFTALAGTTEAQEPESPGTEATPEATAPSPDPEGTTAAPEETVTPDAATPDAGATVEDPASGAAPWVVGALIVLLVGGALWWTTRRRGTPGPPA